MLIMDEITVCPQCASIHVSWVAGGIAGAIYKCDECGYVGSFVLQVKPKDLQRFQDELRKEKE